MRLFVLIPVFLLTACGDKDLSTPSSCNPLGGAACITPWPSSIYEKDDATTATKRRVDIPAGALPKNFDNIEVDPKLYNDHDGWSYAAPAMIAFEDGIDGGNLVHYSEYAKSLTADSPTVLINMATKELVPHFAELDAREPDRIESQALYVRPSKMLEPGTRYAV